jgi:hypothetical protein
MTACSDVLSCRDAGALEQHLVARCCPLIHRSALPEERGDPARLASETVATTSTAEVRGGSVIVTFLELDRECHRLAAAAAQRCLVGLQPCGLAADVTKHLPYRPVRLLVPAVHRVQVAVARARTLLPAQSSAVDQVFHYGVTPLSTENLVVWVLLKGAEDELPAWYFPGDSSTAQPGLLADLEALQAEVRRCFAAESWPDAGNVRVGFDSADRVASQGGWHYFK